MKSSKIISLITAMAILISFIPSVVLAEDADYMCDFTLLVKDGIKTDYGTASDIISIDANTTAHLTYEGTYVDADGTVHLTGADAKKLTGSYIEFTAPSNGTVSYTGKDISYFINGQYSNQYGSSVSMELTEGQKFQLGYRKGTSAVKTLSFKSATEEQPPVSGGEAEEYQSPSTSWSFDAAPPSEGKNVPVMGGSAVWSGGEIQFPASDTKSGSVTVDMKNSIRNNITIEFDAIDHSKALGQQFFNYSVKNSEEIIVDFQVHPYDETPAKGLMICGAVAADDKAVRSAWGGVGNHHIKTDIDYNARTVTVTIGNTSFSGELPEGTISDFKKLEISSTRSKTAGERYISLDNLTISEFNSTEPPADITVTDGYELKTIAGYPCRIKEQTDAPAVIYLASEMRCGTDTYSQLYDAKPFFDKLSGRAALIAPQSAEIFSDITALVDEVRTTAREIIVIGQSESVNAALSSGADKIITIAGAGTAKSVGKVWAFAGYNDDTTSVSNVRTMINSLQTSGIDARYTEYPYEGHKITAKAAAEIGLEEWILSEQTEIKTVDLAIFMGQSNMAGRGDYENAVPCAPGHGFEYHPITEPGVLTTVSEPFGKHENNDAVNDNSGSGVDRRSGDMVSAFMENYYQTAGTPLVGVQCSRGGTESKWWNDSAKINEAAARYNEAKAYLESCGYTVGKQFMVWCQGCSDADSNRSAALYKANTKAIFDAMKSQTGLTDMFMIRIGRCKTSGAAAIDEVKDARYKAINLAQKELADTEQNITAVASFYTDEYAALMRDQYHYHQEAYNSVGAIAGNNTAYTLYSTGAWTDYPEPPSEPAETPVPIDKFELVSSAPSVDISGLTTYGNTDFRIYNPNGDYESATAQNGEITNSSGGEITIVPEYKFEFTNQSNPSDEKLKGYVKVGENSYTVGNGYGLLSGAEYNINENGCRAVDGSPIRIKLPAGFYDVEIYRKGGARADVYANGVQIINNTTSSGSQNRPSGSAVMEAYGMYLDGGTVDFTFGNLSGNNERIASIKIIRVPETYRKPNIWIAGDSESANYYPVDAEGNDLDSEKLMMTGFGMQLKYFLSDKYNIANFGQPSATVKTWYDECFESVNKLMQAEDTLIIDFGINDSISSSNKITLDEMKQYMKDICDAAKAKGAAPIIVSPVYNGKYQHRTYFTYNADTDSNEMYTFAEQIGVNCIDLNKYTQLYVNQAKSQTGDPDWIANNYHVNDNLHMTQYSALLDASIIAAGMSGLGYETTDYAYTYKDISSVEDGFIKGEYTGVSRVYSVAEAKKFMNGGEPSKTKVTMSYNENTGVLTAVSNDASIKGGTLIKAVYDDGSLKSVTTQNLSFSNNTATADITAEKGMTLYLWNSVSNMQPLAEAVKYTGDGTTIKPTIEPTNAPLFSRNFEDGDLSGWRQSNGGVNSIMQDNNSKICKYMNQQGGGGGSRAVEYKFSKPFTDNFVFEADIKAASTAECLANISLLGSPTTVNSTGTNNVPVDGLILKADIPTKESRFILNNEKTSKSSTLESITGKKLLSSEFEKGSWVHIRAICNFDDQTAKIQLTSLDGGTVYFDGKADMYEGKGGRITDLQRIYIVAPRPNENFGIDNIVVRKANKSELAETADFHSVRIVNRGDIYDYYIENNKPINELYIPDVSVYGGAFKGWEADGAVYTTQQLKLLPITKDTTITAYIDSEYIENVQGVEFANFPTDNRLVMSADANGTDFYENKISLKIQGEAGSDLASAPDERANPKIEWEFTGFHTMHGEPTKDDKTTVFPGTKQYCDSYGKVTVESDFQPELSFALRNTSENYYGKVKATVTYNNNTFIVERPLIILADTAQKTGLLLPKPGYTSDFNMFEEGMEGDYTANKTLLGGWNTAGSNSTNRIGIAKDGAEKYMRISKNEKRDSSYFYNEISTAREQLIFEQNIRFNTPVASIYYKGEDVTSFKKNQSAFTAVYQDGVLSINGQKIADNLSQGTWYRLVLSSAVSSQKCWAKVYSKDGGLLGETAVLSFENASVASPYVFAYRLNDRNNAASSVDLNNVTIKKSELDASKFQIEFDNVNAAIPDSGAETTVNAFVSAETTEGYEAIGEAVWSVADDSIDGVSVTANENTHTAVISIRADAAAGKVPLRADIDGQSVTAELVLTGTRESVAFVNKPKSILIPSGESVTAECSAVVRDGLGNEIDGRAVSYSLETPVRGVSINEITGEITVSPDAKASKAVVIALAQNTAGQPITRKTSVIIYSLNFSFGSGAAADNQTMVTAETAYDDALGFGIEGAAENNSGYLSGSDIVFKANVAAGKVYNITVSYEGTLYLEKYNRYLTGIKKDTNSALTSKTYEVAVVGDGETVGKGILDLNLAGTGKLASVKIEEQPVKTAGEKPAWIEIGDSTVAQNPSWGYVLAGKWQSYPELAGAVDNFRNMGRGARQLTSFYNEGLLDSVLRTIRPNDVVSISGMGTNGYSGTIEDFKAQLNYYIDSVIQMGGKVILGSYTPNGNWGSYKGKVYNEQTETFTGKRYDDFDVALYEVYQSRKDDKNILGYVDIGAITDELMTAEVRKARDAAGGSGAAADEAAANKAEELLKWYPNDFNHYTGDLSNLILPELTKQVATLIKR